MKPIIAGHISEYAQLKICHILNELRTREMTIDGTIKEINRAGQIVNVLTAYANGDFTEQETERMIYRA